VIKRILILLLFGAALNAPAQTGIGIGYNLGKYTQSLHNLEVLAYEFNQAHPNYEDQYHFKNSPNGLCFIFFSETDKHGYECTWSNKHTIATAEGADVQGDTIMRHQLKARMNTLDFAVYTKFGKPLRLGISYDLGFFRVLKKVAPVEEYKEAKWEKVFDKKGFFSNWFTLFIDLKAGPVHVRPYFQTQILTGTITYSNIGAFVYKDYAFRTSNAGVTLMATFGSKD
jgi:hypothetical protein